MDVHSETDSGLSANAAAWVEPLDEACNAIAAAIARTSPEERRRPVGPGAGGDVTVQVDAMAEEALIAAIEPVAVRTGGATLIAEERGQVALGGGGPATVVVDPIDGSLNATRGLPIFATSVAVADGPTMADVWLGYVRDFGSGATYVAERGRGAWRDGVRLRVNRTAAPSVVAFEGASPRRLAAACEPLDGHVHRVRAMGSLALSLCAVAGSACEAMAGLTPARSVDTAGAQLICLEAGALVGMPGEADLATTSLAMDARHVIIAANGHDALALVDRARQAAAEAAASS